MNTNKTEAEKVIKHIEAALKQAYTYSEYEALIERLLAKNESTTKGADVEMVYYSQLGLQRMRRWDKRLKISEKYQEFLRNYTAKHTWIVITEGWCGDAAHSVPVLQKMVELMPNVELKLVLREENPELMNDFLTNGGKSIPKLIIYQQEDQIVEGSWGPRPEPAQQIFLKAKAAGIDFETYEKDLQMWYNKDKGQTLTEEMIQLLAKIK